MNKKLMTAAIGAALAASPMLASAGATVGGYLHMSLDRSQGPNAAQERGFESSNANVLSIKGDEDIGDGWKAVYQFETGTFLSDTGGTSATNTGLSGRLRNNFVGFTGPWGTAKFGRDDSPMKKQLTALDDFRNRIGDARNVAGGNAGSNNPAGVAFFDERFSNSSQYESPSFGGAKVHAMYGTAEGLAPGTNGGVDMKSLVVSWAGGPVDVRLGYERHVNTGTLTSGTEETNMRLTGSYKIGGFTIGALYEKQKDMVSAFLNTALAPFGYVANTPVENTDYGVFGSFTFGSEKIIAKYQKSNEAKADGSSLSGTDHSLWAIGIDHNFSKTALVYFAYCAANNGTNYKYTACMDQGHGNTVAPVNNGEKLKAYSVGTILRF